MNFWRVHELLGSPPDFHLMFRCTEITDVHELLASFKFMSFCHMPIGFGAVHSPPSGSTRLLISSIKNHMGQFYTWMPLSVLMT